MSSVAPGIGRDACDVIRAQSQAVSRCYNMLPELIAVSASPEDRWLKFAINSRVRSRLARMNARREAYCRLLPSEPFDREETS